MEVSGSYPNASKYVRVSSVNLLTPNYLDNSGTAKAQYTSSIPLNASGSFNSATGTLNTGVNAKYYDNITTGVTNTQGLTGSDYNNMINLLSNQDDYRFNVMITPGLFSAEAPIGASQVTSIINNTQNRGDNIYVVDLVAYNATSTAAVTAANAKNTSYAAAYWPWVQTIDPDSAQLVWVPASTMVAGVYAYNDNVSEPWFAPAGINRGGLGNVVRAAQKLSQTNRDTLYQNKINPIATFPGTGVVVYGQKTLQTKASALDRVNVRRLLISLKSYISQVANNLVFEQNTIATRNQFLSQVNPYLTSVQQRQGLYAFRVIMDDSNNTPDVIDRNQLVGQIYLQPTKTAEFIYLNFNILPTGVSFG
jgi:phage tail sheath protein FI